MSDFTDTDYKPVTITIAPGIGEAGYSLAYVRRHNVAIDGPVKDQYDHVIAISSRCVHVGCPVRYVEAAAAFVLSLPRWRLQLPRDPNGRPAATAAGPLLHADPRRPRAARTRASASTTNSGASRRGIPASPLDGIGQFLYPARPSTAPAPPGAKS